VPVTTQFLPATAHWGTKPSDQGGQPLPRRTRAGSTVRRCFVRPKLRWDRLLIVNLRIRHARGKRRRLVITGAGTKISSHGQVSPNARRLGLYRLCSWRWLLEGGLLLGGGEEAEEGRRGAGGAGLELGVVLHPQEERPLWRRRGRRRGRKLQHLPTATPTPTPSHTRPSAQARPQAPAPPAPTSMRRPVTSLPTKASPAASSAGTSAGFTCTPDTAHKRLSPRPPSELGLRRARLPYLVSVPVSLVDLQLAPLGPDLAPPRRLHARPTPGDPMTASKS
jgi:hypothetical protein